MTVKEFCESWEADRIWEFNRLKDEILSSINEYVCSINQQCDTYDLLKIEDSELIIELDIGTIGLSKVYGSSQDAVHVTYIPIFDKSKDISFNVLESEKHYSAANNILVSFRQYNQGKENKQKAEKYKSLVEKIREIKGVYNE